jgi:hypothetical protein
MHSGQSPRLLPPDQLAFASNVTNRNAIPKTRPAIRKISLTYYDEDTQTGATEGLIQGASFHQGYGGSESCLLASISGRIFRYFVGSTNQVDELGIGGSVPNPINDPTRPQTWQWQSEDFTIIQDGQSNPLFYDGVGLRRSLGDAGGELPAGTVGCYVQGRNWTALVDRQNYVASDLVYSHGFAGPYNGRDAVLRMDENTFLSGGGAFAVPITAGQITSMSSVAIPDTSLGQGPLLVGTANMVFTVQVPLDRIEWSTTTYPLVTIGLPSYGPASQWSTVVVNGDIWYRAIDGIRSYTIARRDFNTWVNTPLSIEMTKIISSDTQALLGYASGVVFDNRLLETCSPYRVNCRGIAHRGLIALDLFPISGIERANPSYDGLWTGLPILRILKGTFNNVERCFIFALDHCGRICLYELFPDGEYLFDWDGTSDVAIQSVLESRSMLGPDKGNQLKLLLKSDLFLDRVAGPALGNVAVTIQYRPDEHPIWQDWHTFYLCAPLKDCVRLKCDALQNLWPGYRTFIRMPEPSDATCNTVVNRPMRMGYEFQVRLTWEGYAQLNRLLVWMMPGPESLSTACPTSESCVLLPGCDVDPFTYEIEQGSCTAEPESCYAGATPVPPEPGESGEVPPPPPPPPPPEPERPPPEWPDYPEEPGTWPPITTPAPPVTGAWPPPVTTGVTYDPTWTPPDPGCGGSGVQLYQWLYTSVPVRWPSSDVSYDPNTTFDPALITWWKWHVAAAFWAEMQTAGTTVLKWELFWYPGSSASSCSVDALYSLNSCLNYSGTGWEIWVAYCID